MCISYSSRSTTQHKLEPWAYKYSMPSNVAHKKLQEKISNCMWNSKNQQEDEVYINTHRPRKCRRNRCEYTCGEQLVAVVQVYKY